MKQAYKTTVGTIDADALAFTVGKDPALDRRLVAADCIGSAAHVTMLAALPARPRVMTLAESKRVIKELAGIIRRAQKRAFRISFNDQDVHLAVERVLTERLGETGKRIHTARSRNDQVAVDLRLYGKERMLALAENVCRLGAALMRLAARHKMTPMVGRTHMQPGMPSSVGLWASAYAEGLLDDIALLKNAYALNDRCPLGSAAGYGVPLPIDRRLTAALLGFSRPIHNVLHAGNSRGKNESIILAAASQLMATLSRLAQDLIIFSMPEFNYFALPESMCTGSSIMPQKKNPDILELIRAKAARVFAHAFSALEITRAMPSGYNRDLQEIKEPFIDGLDLTEASLRAMSSLVENIRVNRPALLAAFKPDVFAADHALFLAGQGLPFRDAYRHVKEHLKELKNIDPMTAFRRPPCPGTITDLGLKTLQARLTNERKFFSNEKKRYYRRISRLLGMKYPVHERQNAE
ncbi:MAG: argininosuccinate lyase [Kiritimatiellae bacterium]|nr:argininosuccinate lyase [Kiritimatiellia bacterium]